MTSVHEARETLGRRLREIRKSAGVTGRRLADLAGWHESKVSKIEYGKLKPSDADIRAYCEHCDATSELADLLATLHGLDAAYVESRRLLGRGYGRTQERLVRLAERTTFTRMFQGVVVPGMLQTAEYARAMLEYSALRHRLPGDIEEGVAKRLERQQFLYRGDRKFHILVAEQALLTTVGSDAVMRGQLDRLLAVMGLPQLMLAVVPATATLPMQTHNFVMFDDGLVTVETLSAELQITQPREIATFRRVFAALVEQAVTGDAARELIVAAGARR